MKQKSSIPFFRVLLIFLVIFIISEFIFKTGSDPAFISNPSVALFLVSVFASLIAFEAILSGDRSLGQTKEEEELFVTRNIEEESQGLWKTILKKLTRTKPITEEETILLDHNYDGIKELDNALPPWWLYSFYASIVFAVLYFGYYQLLGGNTNVENFEEEMEIARLAEEQYKINNPSTFDASKITAGGADAGKKIFKSNCAVCHSVDGGGGIGPNLTDEYWILGGGIKNVYNTISEGGRDGKGMIAWKNSLNPEKIKQVASYILTLQGTTAKKPKEKEGDLWTGE